MSPRLSGRQLRKPVRSRLTRATASISRERSTPTACSTPRPEQLEHPAGAGADVEEIANALRRQQRDERRLDLALRHI